MDYVVSPVTIYFIMVLGGIRNCFVWLIILASIFIIVACAWMISLWRETDGDCLEEIEENDDEESEKKAFIWLRKYTKKYIGVVIILSILLVIIPNYKTRIAMLVAKNVTYTNIEKAKLGTKEAIDYIFKKVNEQPKGGE